MKGYKVPSSLIDEIERKALHIGDFSYTNGMDKVIDAIKDLDEVELDNHWHTGTPTEEGDYLVQYKNSGHDVLHFADLSWFAFNRGGVEWQKIPDSSVVAYQKIEPYKEEKQ